MKNSLNGFTYISHHALCLHNHLFLQKIPYCFSKAYLLNLVALTCFKEPERLRQEFAFLVTDLGREGTLSF